MAKKSILSESRCLHLSVFLSDIIMLIPVFINAGNSFDDIAFFRSKMFEYSIVASLAIFVPTLVDLFMDLVAHIRGGSENYDQYLRATTGAISFVSNVVILTDAFPENNFLLVWSMWNIQFLHLVHFLIQYLRIYAPDIWTHRLTLGITLMTCVMQVLRTYSYETFGQGNTIGILGIVLFVAVFVSLSVMTLQFVLSIPQIASFKFKIDDLSCIFKSAVILLLFIMYAIIATGIFDNKPLRDIDPGFAASITYLLTSVTMVSLLFHSHRVRLQVLHTQTLLEMKRIFVRYVSHEIRTPLNTVFIGLNLLHDDLENRYKDKEMIETVDDIKESCDVAVNILNDLLMYEKLEGGLLSLELKDISIWNLVTDVSKKFNVQARQKNIDYAIIHEDPLLSRVRVIADRHKLAQVLRNLISNALKFTPQSGSVRIRASIIRDILRSNKSSNDNNNNSRRVPSSGVIAPTESGFIKIEVEDTGSGIAVENQGKLFKEIIQFSPDELQNGQGSGLGLWISSRIMEMHHGTIGVFSKGESFGTTFHIILPIAYYEGNESVKTSFRKYVVSDIEAGVTRPDDTSTDFASNIPTNNGAVQTEVSLYGSEDNSMDQGGAHVSLEKASGRQDNGENASGVQSPPPRSRTQANDICDRNSRLISIEESHMESKELILGRSCLVVDDSITNRKLLLRLFKSRFVIGDSAANGQEAVDKVAEKLRLQQQSPAEHMYDLIILDHQMPVMDGPTAIREIRKLGFEGVVIGLTGNALAVDINEFESSGADKVLIKPLDIEAFHKIYLEIKRQKASQV